MTPAIKLLQHHRIAHTVREYEHDPASESYGREAAAKLGVPEAQVFKTLVVQLDGKELVVGVIPVSAMLSLKAIAKAAKGKKKAGLTYYLDSLQGPAILFGRAITSGFDLDYLMDAKTTLSFSVHTAGRGESPDVSGAVSIRRAF